MCVILGGAAGPAPTGFFSIARADHPQPHPSRVVCDHHWLDEQKLSKSISTIFTVFEMLELLSSSSSGPCANTTVSSSTSPSSLAAQIRERVRDGTPFCSLEFYPPFKDDADSLGKFLEMVAQLQQAQPLFVDITWTRRNDPGNLARCNSSTFVAAAIRQIFGANTMLHLCCNGYTKAETLAHLEQATRLGISNILALRGDLPVSNGKANSAKNTTAMPTKAAPVKNGGLVRNGHQRRDFYAIDLVKWIREQQPMGGGTDGGGRRKPMMSVAVAGDPCPLDARMPYAEHMTHLKNKVDAGADFIVTQFFLDIETFEQFRRECRCRGIDVPILPGILLFKNATSLKKIAAIANVPIPPGVARVLEANRGNPIAVQNYAIHLAYEMCRHLLASGQTVGVHIFTMNQPKIVETLLKQLGFWPTIRRPEPWQKMMCRNVAAAATAGGERLLMARPAKCVFNDQKLYSFKCRFYA